MEEWVLMHHLKQLGLDTSGGLGVRQNRLKEANFPSPNPNASSLSEPQSQLSQPSQSSESVQNASQPSIESREQWNLIKKTRGPVYTRIPKASLPPPAYSPKL